MADGYQHAGENEFADLDEWLCEYVDGTIDPVVCKALEEYMEHNHRLASHVERLRETRHLLCKYGCSYQAPSGLQPRLRRRLASEIIQEAQPLLGNSLTPLMTVATLTSLFAILLILAASTETFSPRTFVTTAQSAISSTTTTPATASSIPRLLPYRRATPLVHLTTSKHFARFAEPSGSYRLNHLHPSFYPASRNYPSYRTLSELELAP